MIKIHRLNQGSNEWLELRGNLYTGTDADKLLSYYDSTKIVNGVTSPFAQKSLSKFRGNFWTRRGHVLEEEAIEIYEATRNVKVMVSPEAGFVTNSKYPTCGYSPDGLAPIPLIEVKCFDLKQHYKLVKGVIPIKILAQIHFGLLITERPYAHLIAYNPKVENNKDAFVVITIKANKNILANFRRILKREAAR